jgi:hypothetical protein
MWRSRGQVASLPLVLGSLLAPVLLAGCSEPETLFELGRRFTPEAPPPGQARIYVFWPPASPAFRGTYHFASPLSAVQLLPGGYLSQAALPGRIVFQIERSWRLGENDIVYSRMPGPELAFTVEAGRVYYLGVVPRPGLVDQLALQPVDAATGGDEVLSCRLLRWKSVLYGGD